MTARFMNNSEPNEEKVKKDVLLFYDVCVRVCVRVVH